MTWLLAFALVFGGLAALEATWRTRDFRPRLPESEERWRREVQAAVRDHDGVSIVGSSRAQLGLDPDLLAAEIGVPVHQLSVGGANPVPLLAHLVQATDLSGLVLVEFMPSRFFGEDLGGRASSESHLACLTNPSPIVGVEAQLRELVTSRLTSTSNQVALASVARTVLADRSLPRPSARRVLENRQVVTDLALVADRDQLDRRWARQYRERPRLSAADQRAQLEFVRDLRIELERRGASVLFFRPPSSGRTAAAEAELFPRERYYERARATIGGRWWHFADDPAVAQLTCFDGSHLSTEDAVVYSRALADVVRGLPRR